jgi:hypothetical protein
MKAPLKPAEYPMYFKKDRMLYAFVGKDKMFKIEPRGTNKNNGVAIDHYITRSMVIKHMSTCSPYDKITVSEFTNLVARLFNQYISKIINY